MMYGLAMLLFAGSMLFAAGVVVNTARAQGPQIRRALHAMVQTGDQARRTPWPTTPAYAIDAMELPSRVNPLRPVCWVAAPVPVPARPRLERSRVAA